jgi:uncharacterized membrane protein YGL010W
LGQVDTRKSFCTMLHSKAGEVSFQCFVVPFYLTPMTVISQKSLINLITGTVNINKSSLVTVIENLRTSWQFLPYFLMSHCFKTSEIQKTPLEENIGRKSFEVASKTSIDQ